MKRWQKNNLGLSTKESLLSAQTVCKTNQICRRGKESICFFPFFIFSPELKYSQGLGNILIYNPNLEQTNVVEKVLSRTFTISLHFEG